MSPYAVRLSTQETTDRVVKPSEASPDTFLARLAEIEREDTSRAELHPELSNYEGEFADGAEVSGLGCLERGAAHIGKGGGKAEHFVAAAFHNHFFQLPQCSRCGVDRIFLE